MEVPRRSALLLSFLILALLILFITIAQSPVAAAESSAGGSLQLVSNGKSAGFCPLRHTDVKVALSGFIARVQVSQEFENPSSTGVEAIYTFPLPQDAAVDDMTIEVGQRTIRGVIKRREEAAAIYEKAIRQGQTAALLDQERPNIFTQSVGNIPPGDAIRVTISFVSRLKYEDGGYEFVFPTVVGPRYIPGQAVGKKGGGFAPDTEKVPDASKVTPPVAPPETRAGHDISISVALDAGVPIRAIRSPSHKIDVNQIDATSAVVRLKNESVIPNKDFILRYNVAGPSIAEGLLTHTDSSQKSGYFTLVIQPPSRIPESDITPKEIVFVLDSSGSMGGFPIEKSRRLIDYAINGLYPGDTFNVIKFSGETAILFDEPAYPSAANVERAKEFVNKQWGGGGTEMMKAIKAALDPSDASEHVRIVVFLTDGYVGNDMEIISEIQKHPNARVFAYGIGSSVNRFLLDNMARAGRGAVEYVSHKQNDKEAETAADRLYERLRAPLLTDVSLDFGSLPVAEVYPPRIPDLFSGQPIVVTGRYLSPARGGIKLAARRAGAAYTRDIPATFPAVHSNNPVLSSLWAREKVEDLMSQDWAGLQRGHARPEIQKQIEQVGLEHHLMTQFTSFVAIEERVVTDGGKPRRIQVPVELPAGVQYEEGWGRDNLISPQRIAGLQLMAKLSAPPQATVANATGGGGGGDKKSLNSIVQTRIRNGAGMGAGYGGGIGGGAYRVGGAVSAPREISAPAPQYSEEARKANLQGTVVLWVVISPEGTVSDIRVQRSLGLGLDEKAMEAVRTWKFEPAKKDGKPVAVQVNIEVTFGNDAAKSKVAPTTAASSEAGKSKQSRKLDQKLHPSLVSLYDCWHAQTCKVENQPLINVVISGDEETAMKGLSAIGFEPASEQGRAHNIRGRIEVEKFAALAELKFVKFVAIVAH